MSFILACNSGPLMINSLDDFIDARLGRNHGSDMHQSGPSEPDVRPPEDVRSRSARIRAFRAQQQASKLGTPRPSRPPASLKAVHLLSAEEVKSLFRDVTAGLAFLVCDAFFRNFWLLTGIQAQQVHTTSRPKTRKCFVDVGSRETDTSRDAVRLWHIPGHGEFSSAVRKHWDVRVRVTRVTTLSADGYPGPDGFQVGYMVAWNDSPQTALLPPSVCLRFWWGW